MEFNRASRTVLVVLGSLWPAAAGPVRVPEKPADLFAPSSIWTIHLKFTAAQWAAIEPKGGPQGMPFGGGPGGGFPGPSMFVAPAFLKGDDNHDGKLSSAEFQALGEKWFAEWDKEKHGKLTADELRSGLNSVVPMPAFGPPGGFGRGPGGGPAGGPGGGPGGGMQGAPGKRNGMSGMSGIDFEYVHADLDFEGRQLQDIAVRYKGNSSFAQARNSIKRSLKLDLNKYVKGQKLAGLSKLNLHNSVMDPSWMNEALSYGLFRDAGVPSPRTSFARVFVTVPDKFERKYFGLYEVVEDVDKTFAQDRFGTSKGAIFKPSTRDLFRYQGDDWTKYNQAYDPKTPLTPGQKVRVIEFAKLVTSAPDAEFTAKLPEFLDIEEFARFMSATVWLSNLDSILSMGQNFYVYLHPDSNRFQFLPWDLDHSFGQFPMGGSQEQREKLSVLKPWSGQNRFLDRVFKDDAFRKVYLARMTEMSKTIFVPERISRQVDQTAALIRPAVAEESSSQLTRFDKVVAGEPVAGSGFDGGPGGRGPGGGAPAKPIKGFIVARAPAVADQLAGKPNAEAPAGGFGFGGPGGRGPGMGPGMGMDRAFMQALDADKDGAISHEELMAGFAKWFESWNVDKTGMLTAEQLRSGIDRDLSPFRPGMGGPPR